MFSSGSQITYQRMSDAILGKNCQHNQHAIENGLHKSTPGHAPSLWLLCIMLLFFSGDLAGHPFDQWASKGWQPIDVIPEDSTTSSYLFGKCWESNPSWKQNSFLWFFLPRSYHTNSCECRVLMGWLLLGNRCCSITSCKVGLLLSSVTLKLHFVQITEFTLYVDKLTYLPIHCSC